jgi:tRNA G10  N-methylase Trm11
VNDAASILVSCAAFGALVVGSDLDPKVVHGKGMSMLLSERASEPLSLSLLSTLRSQTPFPPLYAITTCTQHQHPNTYIQTRAQIGEGTIQDNFAQYGLQSQLVDVLINDNSTMVWRRGGLFDAITCDRT